MTDVDIVTRARAAVAWIPGDQGLWEEMIAEIEKLREARYLVPGFEDGVTLANGNTDQALNVSAELVKKLSGAVAEVAKLRADNGRLRARVKHLKLLIAVRDETIKGGE